MTNYSIIATSDIVCPWCYVGETRLKRAIANHKTRFPDDTFTLKYLPYYLNPPPQAQQTSSPKLPPFPVKSRPRREMYAEKFGPARAQQIEAMMSQVSRAEGLDFKFGGMTGPSRNGHRLVWYAQEKGGEEAQDAVMQGLWKRYFELEVDVTELEVLVQVGVQAGLGSEEGVREFLISGMGGVEVDKIAEEKRDEGITGVPNYVVQGLWEVSGAQDPLAFEKLFMRWKEREEKEGRNGTGLEGAKKSAGVAGNGCL